MTILACCHFGMFAAFKHYYKFFIKEHLKHDFPNAVSYNRFVELMPVWDRIMLRKRHIKSINDFAEEQGKHRVFKT